MANHHLSFSSDSMDVRMNNYEPYINEEIYNKDLQQIHEPEDHLNCENWYLTHPLKKANYCLIRNN